jgi:hypothetical protein
MLGSTSLVLWFGARSLISVATQALASPQEGATCGPLTVTTARRTDVPERILAMGPLADPSYSCAFAIAAPPSGARSAENWLRGIMEGAPAPMRWSIVAGWVGVLRLRLGPRPSPDHVLGWRVVSTSPTEIVIGVEGPLLSARQVVEVQQDAVLHPTIIRYDQPAARALWGMAAPIHVRTIPYLMEHTS